MSSWTFGSEVLYIPKIFGRPVYIGVYGHPRYQESRYILTANFLEDEEYDPYKIKVEFDAKAQSQPRDNDKDSKSPKVKLYIIYFSGVVMIFILWSMGTKPTFGKKFCGGRH